MDEQDPDDKLQVQIYKHQQSTENEIKRYEETGNRLMEAQKALKEVEKIGPEIDELLKKDEVENHSANEVLQMYQRIKDSGTIDQMLEYSDKQ